MSNETPSLPVEIQARSSGGGGVEAASATFYRTQYNTNIQLTIPQGLDSGGISVQTALVPLPANTFNSYSDSDSISIVSQYAEVSQAVDIIHNIKILVKIQQVNGTNYTNYRELRCFPIDANGNVYSSSVGANYQPATGDLFDVLVDGKVSHNSGDQITLGFQVAQVTANASDTSLTIFRIDWLMTAII